MKTSISFVTFISCAILLSVHFGVCVADETGTADQDEVEKTIEEVESNFKTVIDDLSKRLMPVAVGIGIKSEASLKCLFDLAKIFMSVKNLEAWAIRMMDATGKPSGGLMEGTSTALGDYDECLDTVSPSKYPIFGEYCLLEFLGFLQKVRSNPDHVIFRLGVCVPSSCSTKGIQSMMDRVNSPYLGTAAVAFPARSRHALLAKDLVTWQAMVTSYP
ncbi:NRF domain-containing protein [Trichonephila clavipes]|nr:NRF domain-containing protein [Trichonephila clavipes]